MDFSAQYLHYYSLAYKIGTVFCANVAKGVTCRQPARHSKRSPGGRRNVSPPAQERFPGWWRVFAMCSGGVGPCEPGKSTGEALEPVPGCDPASSRREVPAASSLCGRQAGSPRRSGTAQIPCRTRPAAGRSPGGRRNASPPGTVGYRPPYSVPALCLAESIFTLEAYSLGVMPVTFLKWREK